MDTRGGEDMTLKDLRDRAGLTQMQAATALGITRTSYARYESNDRIPDLEMSDKISELFKVPLDNVKDAILGGSNNKVSHWKEGRCATNQ